MAFAVEHDAIMRTRDGVALSADIFRPINIAEAVEPWRKSAEKNYGGDEDRLGVESSSSVRGELAAAASASTSAYQGPTAPVLLIRTPYDRAWKQWKFSTLSEPEFFASRGYIVVAQDVRGRFRSEGVFLPCKSEFCDGADAVQWCSESIPGSNGQVGALGQSYMGHCVLAMIAERPPALRAACVVSGFDRPFENAFRRHGCFELSFVLGYFNLLGRTQRNINRCGSSREWRTSLARAEQDEHNDGKAEPGQGEQHSVSLEPLPPAVISQLDEWVSRRPFGLRAAWTGFRLMGWRHLCDMMNLIFPLSARVLETLPRASLGDELAHLLGEPPASKNLDGGLDSIAGLGQFLAQILRQDEFNELWAEFERRDSNSMRAGAGTVPTLHVGSFYDYFSESTVRLFAEDVEMESQAFSNTSQRAANRIRVSSELLTGTVAVRGNSSDNDLDNDTTDNSSDNEDAIQSVSTQTAVDGLSHSSFGSAASRNRLLLGPWGHIIRFAKPNAGGAGIAKWGDGAKIELHEIQLRYFDWILKGSDNGVASEAPVCFFPMNLHAATSSAPTIGGFPSWFASDSWPPSTVHQVQFTLSSDASPQAASEDATSIQFTYDPRNPVPTLGGCVIAAEWDMGVIDQRSLHSRHGSDIVRFRINLEDTDNMPLDESDPWVVCGNVHASLVVGSTAPDTDFTAKLIYQTPTGKEFAVVDSIARVKFSAAEDSQVRTSVDINLGPTCTVLEAGSQLFLDISSSNFPRFDVNPNSGRSSSSEPRENWNVATQTLFCAAASLTPVTSNSGNLSMTPACSTLTLPLVRRSEASLIVNKTHGDDQRLSYVPWKNCPMAV